MHKVWICDISVTSIISVVVIVQVYLIDAIDYILNKYDLFMSSDFRVKYSPVLEKYN